jgi:hypothetical protein
VRDEGDTSLAVRDEIVALVQEALTDEDGRQGDKGKERASGSRSRRRSRGKRGGQKQAAATSGNGAADATAVSAAAAADDASDAFYLPQIGVEIVDSEKRHGNTYHSICDLRNNTVIKNVTRKGARKLWNYAIIQHEDHPVDAKAVQWKGNVGLIRAEKRAGKIRYDLALRENGDVRVFYGVTEDGMEGKWNVFLQDD